MIFVFCVLVSIPFVALIVSGYMEKRDQENEHSGIIEFQNFKDALQ